MKTAEVSSLSFLDQKDFIGARSRKKKLLGGDKFTRAKLSLRSDIVPNYVFFYLFAPCI